MFRQAALGSDWPEHQAHCHSSGPHRHHKETAGHAWPLLDQYLQKTAQLACWSLTWYTRTHTHTRLITESAWWIDLKKCLGVKTNHRPFCRAEGSDAGRLFVVIYFSSLLLRLPSPPLSGPAVCRWGQRLADQGSSHSSRWAASAESHYKTCSIALAVNLMVINELPLARLLPLLLYLLFPISFVSFLSLLLCQVATTAASCAACSVCG